jgi:3-oxoacyl-[acyl-carrier protein] reductase
MYYNMGELNGKNAFVSGTSQGIGAAIAKALIESGCNVCMHYYNSDLEPLKLKEMAEKRNQMAICLQADLTKEPEVKNCIKSGVDFLNSFDILVNNSGALVKRCTIDALDLDFWNTMVNINITTTMLVTKELLPYMNRIDGSSIVNISSMAGRAGGHPGSLAYSTFKGAVLTWTRALAKELGPENIRVNAVAPGFIEGTRFHKIHTSRESAIKTISSIPLGRSGNPEDVARAVLFLASEYNGFITGETIDINGGIYCA